MTTHTAVTMQDLELESAELLPGRETLHCFGKSPYPGSSYSYTNVVGNTSQSQEGFGNIAVSAFNGEGNSLNLLNL